MVKAFKCPAAEPKPLPEKRTRSSGEVPDFQIPTILPKKAKVCVDAPVFIGMQRFSDNSVMCLLPGKQEKVTVVMMAHDAKPCMFF